MSSVSSKHLTQQSPTVTNFVVLQVKNDSLYVVITVGCSGIPCQNIYIFKDMEQHWQLIAISQARVKAQIEIGNKDDNVLFKTKSGQISGEFRR